VVAEESGVYNAEQARLAYSQGCFAPVDQRKGNKEDAEAAKELDFERAAVLRDQVYELKRLLWRNRMRLPG
jgi:protein-arginine kinase activator protein McsA